MSFVSMCRAKDRNGTSVRFPALLVGVEKVGLPLFSPLCVISKAPLSVLWLNGRRAACKALSRPTQAFLPDYPLPAKQVFLHSVPGTPSARRTRACVGLHARIGLLQSSRAVGQLSRCSVSLFYSLWHLGKASDPGWDCRSFLLCFLSPHHVFWVLFVCFSQVGNDFGPVGANCSLICFQ